MCASSKLAVETQRCAGYRCSLPSKKKVILVDTPGFDDTHRTDTDVLRELASWLVDTYQRDIKLTGIIYLHRIVDVRVGGTSLRNLRIFRRLVGDKHLSSIILVTTFWDDVNLEQGGRFEAELQSKQEFWAQMIKLGSKTFRHDAGRRSGGIMIKHLLDKAQRADYEIQRQMVDQGLALDETAAGDRAARRTRKGSAGLRS